MLFSSISFLFVFFPLTIGLYTVVPYRFRNAVLLVAGLVFYGFGDPFALPLMAALVFFAWRAAFSLAAGCSETRARILFAVPVVFLATCKLLPFIPWQNGFLTSSFHVPVGVSFYTFQALSYMADVRRGEVPPQRKLSRILLYISLFPQLIAGPIVRYAPIADELTVRRGEPAPGLERFIFGLSKKLLIANPLGALFAEYAAIPDPGAPLALLAILCFAFQIYFDFSGYSDMAIGLGLLFGFHFPENFRYPYTATGIADFWRRWHITLTDFFRAYVYIPLGGNRHGIARTVRNITIVWLLTGVWHGITPNFLLWGLYYCILLLSEKYVMGGILNRLPTVCKRILTLSLVLFGWVLFAFDDPATLGAFCRSLFTGLPCYENTRYEWLRNIPALLVAALFSTGVPYRRYRFMCQVHPGVMLPVCLTLLILCTAALTDASYNPFLYFRF